MTGSDRFSKNSRQFERFSWLGPHWHHPELAECQRPPAANMREGQQETEIAAAGIMIERKGKLAGRRENILEVDAATCFSSSYRILELTWLTRHSLRDSQA